MLRAFVVLLAALALPAVAPAQADSTTAPDPIAQLVARLDLERYKATITGLTTFGDRRQGTDRNRATVDWIEAQLRSYGCSNVARLKYEYKPASPPSPGGRGGQGVRTDESGGQGVRPPPGGGRYRGIRAQTGVNTDSLEQRRALQGSKDEPKWLGMIQHDMMLFDHGMPRADGTLPPEQRPEADVNIEFQSSAKFAAEAERLAWTFERANEKYATDYPASVGSHMTNTDSAPFQDYVPAISLRENERGTQIGAGWDPNWHQPTDLYATYSDNDFRLGLNAAQTTLGAIAGLVGATIK